MNKLWKSFICFSALLLSSVGTANAVEIKDGPAAMVEDGNVVVTWTTDGISGTRLHYGRQPALLNQKEEGAVGITHKVTLEDLQPDSTYYFALGTSKRWLASGTLTFSSSGKVVIATERAGSTSTSSTASASATNPSKSGETTESRPLPKLTPSKPAPVKPPAKDPPPAKVPPTSKTWGYMPSLQDHYERHGRDFQSTSADDYAAKAWKFLQYAKRNNLPMKWDAADRTLRIWEPKSRAFAAYNANGTTKTFFRPNSESYWARQPGRPIKPDELPF